MNDERTIYCGLHVQDGQIVCWCCNQKLGAWTGTYDDETFEIVSPSGFCWACSMGYCDHGPHNDQPEGFESEPPDEDDIAQPCPICGSSGACEYDTLGRALIHAIAVDDD